MDLIQWQKENRWNNKNMAKSLGITAGYLSSIRNKKKTLSLYLANFIVLFTNEEVTLLDLGVEEK